MATQQDGSETIIDDEQQQAPGGDENAQPAGGGSDDGGASDDLVEPDESSFADPAEYRKALRDYDRKVTLKEVRGEYDRKIDGLTRDLRKQRIAKHNLRAEMEQIRSAPHVGAGNLVPNAPTPEPLPHEFETPQAYAKAWRDWETKSQPTAPSQTQARQAPAPVAQAPDQAVVSEWSGKLQSAAQDPDFVRVQTKIQTEGIGQFIQPQALRQIMVSPIGTSIYKYLGDNPDVAEQIEDLSPSEQVVAVRLLESNIMTGKITPSSAPSHAVAPAPGARIPAVAPKAPTLPPPPAVKPAAPPPTTPKSRTEAKDMNEFMRLRRDRLRKKKP